MKTFRLFTSQVVHSFVDIKAESAYDAETKIWDTDTGTWTEIGWSDFEIVETLEIGVDY